MNPPSSSEPKSDFGRFGVLVLAAGASSRMGCAKLLLPWRGTSVIGHLYETWRELGVGQLAVVMRPGDAPLAAELDRIGWPKADRLENPAPEQGMFSPVLCGANWAGWRPDIGSRIFVLGDQPHLKPETLRRLLEFARKHDNSICEPVFGNKTGHPVILPAVAVKELQNTKAATLKDFLKLTTVRRVQCEVDDTGVSLDMDTPEDYKSMIDTDKEARRQ